MLNAETIAAISLTLTSLTLAEPTSQPAPIAWTTAKHIAYYDASTAAAPNDYAKERGHLDIEYATNRTNLPVLIFFHGGGLTGGDPFIPQCYLNRNTIIVAPAYRLSGQHNTRCPDYINDAAAAVAWTVKNIARFGGDPNKIFVSGHSAGAYLTAMIGCDARYLAKYNLKPTQLAGLIPISGQMSTHFQVRGERNIPQTLIDEYAPIYHASANLPPILLIAGDPTIEWPARPEENNFFAATLRTTGHKDVTYLELKGLDHGTVFEGSTIQTFNFINRLATKIDADTAQKAADAAKAEKVSATTQPTATTQPAAPNR